VYELEKERIFSRMWQYAGLVSEIPNPGDYLAIHAGHIPIIVVRDEANQLSAFVNVCRHRGMPLIDLSRQYGTASDGSPLSFFDDSTPLRRRGSKKSFQCSYHAWTYKLDGSLRAAPRSQWESTFNKSDWPLFSVKVETWGPMMFVNTDPESAPLASTLGTLPKLFTEAGADFDAIMKPRGYREYLYKANWKVTVENFNECYHCPIAHPGLSAYLDVNDTYAWFDEFEFSNWYGTSDKATHQMGHFCFLFPNCGLSVRPGGQSATIMWMLPIGLNQSVLCRQYCFADSISDAEAKERMAVVDQVAVEDKVLCENVQRSIESGVFREGVVFKNSENGVHHFQKVMSRVLG
jgi:choline monooxygenase